MLVAVVAIMLAAVSSVSAITVAQRGGSNGVHYEQVPVGPGGTDGDNTANSSDLNGGAMGTDAAFHQNVQDIFFDYDSFDLRPDAQTTRGRAVDGMGLGRVVAPVRKWSTAAAAARPSAIAQTISD